MVTAVNAAEKCRMEENMKIDSLIFDLDGTLWDSSEGIVATWALVLENYPEIHKKVTAEELASDFRLSRLPAICFRISRNHSDNS